MDRGKVIRSQQRTRAIENAAAFEMLMTEFPEPYPDQTRPISQARATMKMGSTGKARGVPRH